VQPDVAAAAIDTTVDLQVILLKFELDFSKE
jgi:hypothetical protein